MNYNEIFNKIKETIKKHGIEEFYENIKDIEMSEINTLDEYKTFLNSFIKQYYKHSFLNYYGLVTTNTLIKLKCNKLPKFSFKKNTGKIKFYSFNTLAHNAEEDNINSIQITRNTLIEWLDNGLNKLTIDLRLHKGGSFIPFISGMSPILGDNSLFALHKNKVNKEDKCWVNYKNKKFNFKSSFNNNFNELSIPVTVLIGNKTSSAGEFCAVALKGRKNVTFIGSQTAGNLSYNTNYKINNNIELVLTNKFVTDLNMCFYEETFIRP
jgi:C-terminal processing protease CtpA/Prc